MVILAFPKLLGLVTESFRDEPKKRLRWEARVVPSSGVYNYK